MFRAFHQVLFVGILSLKITYNNTCLVESKRIYQMYNVIYTAGRLKAYTNFGYILPIQNSDKRFCNWLKFYKE